MKNKRTFLVSTETGRVFRKISFYIAEILPNEGMKLINNDHTCSMTSNKGIVNEVVELLVKIGELPKNSLDESGYMNFQNKNYNLIVIEGRGLNYVNQY